MVTQSILELRRSIVAVFTQRGYKESCIVRYLNTWDNLQAFMVAHKRAKYSIKIGESFLETVLNKKKFKHQELTSRQKEVYRHILTLNSMLEYGSIDYLNTFYRENVFIGKTGEPFLAFLDAQSKIKQPASIKRYKSDLRVLYHYLVDYKISVKDIDIPFMINFMEYCSQTEKTWSLDDIISTTRVFVRYLCDNLLIKETRKEIWMHILKLRRRTKKIPSVYTKEEVEKIISTPDRSNPTGKRDYAMVLLAARYGLRVSDIVGLRFKHIDWDSNLIKLDQIKTSRPISLPLSEEVGCALIDYIKYGRPKVNSPYIFLRSNAPYKELTPGVLSGNIANWIRTAGIDCGKRKTGTHALRHSLATNLLSVNETLPVISEILGHTTAYSTTAYLKISFAQLRQCALDVPFVPTSFYENLYETDK